MVEAEAFYKAYTASVRTVFIKTLPGVPLVPLLYPTLGREERASILFLNEAFADFHEPFVAVTDDPARADDLLLPHNYSVVKNERAYLQEYAALSVKLGKRIIVFAHGDSDGEVRLPHTLVFRTSQYRGRLRPGEIMMPAYAVDLLRGRAFFPRRKSGRAVIGFCGWARYKNIKNLVGTVVKDGLIDVRALLSGDPHFLARKKGLTFRRRALRVLERSALIRPNFILRSSYSGHRSTIRVNPAQAREEYLENMLSSDLALAVKGDGNYSYRFYEALSAGRIPLLVDTDCILPLEDIIPYDEFVLRVPFDCIHTIDRLAADFYGSLSDDRFVAMQRRSREAFEQHLNIKSFLRYAVDHLL